MTKTLKTGLLFAFSAMLFFSNGYSQAGRRGKAKRLAGTWRLHAAKPEGESKNTVKPMMQRIVFDLKEDGTCDKNRTGLRAMLKRSSTWSFDDESRSLIITDRKGEAESFLVKRVGRRTLVLELDHRKHGTVRKYYRRVLPEEVSDDYGSN